MNVVNQAVIKHKMGLLNLAEELGNVSQACKVMGVSRDTFYRYQEAKQQGGIEALLLKDRRRPERCLHHFVSHPPKEEGIGLVEVLDRVTMQLFVRGNDTMIAAPVQSDIDGIPKGSHYVLLKRANV